MIALIIFILQYIISAIYCWNYTRIAHSKGGRWHGISPDGGDLLFTYFPILNFFYMIYGFFNPAIKDNNRLLKHFKVK